MSNKYLTNLAGLAFRPAEAKDIVKMLRPGMQLLLEREQENPWDENAIKVFAYVWPGSERLIEDLEDIERGEPYFIGYVEKLVNGPIARDLDNPAMTFICLVDKTYDDYDMPARTGMWSKPLISIETLARN